MTLLAVERIKLFSTRSPWWCMALALALPIGFSGLFAALFSAQAGGPALPLLLTQSGSRFGLIVMMVMATLAVTTEYRFGTIRTSFQATPNRTAVLLTKTAVVAVLSLLIGEIAAFGSWALAIVLAPKSDLALRTAEDWREVAGVGLVFAVGAILAVAVGILLRQTAAAVTLIMVWSLLVESLVQLIPKVGDVIHQWMPFAAADAFLSPVRESAPMPLSPWGSLLYFLAISAGILVVSLVVANRRDA